MRILTDLPIRQVFKAARRFCKEEVTPLRSGLGEARKRLGLEPLQNFFAQVVRPLATPETPGAFGLRLTAVDGTVVDVPDTPANEATFSRPTGGRGDGAFPQVRKLSLLEVGTHVELAFTTGPCTVGETSLLDGLLPHLQPGMLLLWDRNFFSYGLWKKRLRKGIHILARVKKRLILKPIRTLRDGSYLAKIYRSAKHHKQNQGGVVVRVIRYTLDDPQRTGHGEEHVLLTTLKDARTVPAKELILLYHERWEIEERLQAESAALLQEAQQQDEVEDAVLGSRRGDELPAELCFREQRLAKIQEAKERLHAQARAEAARQQQQWQDEEAARLQEGKPPREPKTFDATPADKAQTNFTDPGLKMMPQPNKGWEYSGNAQVVVDDVCQIIVHGDVVGAANDKRQAVPRAEQALAELAVAGIARPVDAQGQVQKIVSLEDSDYFSAQAVAGLEALGFEPSVAPERQKHHAEEPALAAGATPAGSSARQQMRAKLGTPLGRAV